MANANSQNRKNGTPPPRGTWRRKGAKNAGESVNENSGGADKIDSATADGLQETKNVSGCDSHESMLCGHDYVSVRTIYVYAKKFPL